MKSELTKAKEIDITTKNLVLERQNYRSISGVSLYNKPVEFHHFVPRSSQGVGYEWNIVAITFEEHRALHDKQNIKVNGKDYYTWYEFETLIHNHLVLRYANWSIERCKYHKGYKKEDYGVTAHDRHS